MLLDAENSAMHSALEKKALRNELPPLIWRLLVGATQFTETKGSVCIQSGVGRTRKAY